MKFEGRYKPIESSTDGKVWDVRVNLSEKLKGKLQ